MCAKEKCPTGVAPNQRSWKPEETCQGGNILWVQELNTHDYFKWPENVVKEFYEKVNPKYLRKHGVEKITARWNKFKPHLVVDECRRKYGKTPDLN